MTKKSAALLLRLVILTTVALGTAISLQAETGVLDFLGERSHVQYENVPREVLAFYYTWYGRPERHGNWVHWGRVDPERHDISASTNYPALGAYDSHDPEVIDTHIRQAQQAGLTGFIATWWGQGTFDDRAFEVLIDRAERKDFRLSVYWETAPGKGSAQIERAVDDLLYVLRKYGDRPSFLKVDGAPVIFVYGRVMGQVPLKAWTQIIPRVRQTYGSDFLLIADGYSETNARVFDGVHTYNICGWVRDHEPARLRELSREAFTDAVALAERHDKISCLTVIPGYDDTKIRSPGLQALRQDGETYRVLWEQAIAADPDWVLITSWNEWHEGSEIEPSWEDGDQYLRSTAQFATRFRATPRAPATERIADRGPDRQMVATLQDLYEDRTIGILPEFSSDIVFWLADAGLRLQELEWADLLDADKFNADRFPLIVSAGGEDYRSSVRSDGDVIRSLQRYLRDGGMLMAVPQLPYPFFYNETGRARNAAGRVGLPISGSNPPREGAGPEPFVAAWESPPADVQLTFHVDTRHLSGLDATVPFPATGDLRWRPATPSVVGANDRYLPLASLRDRQGRSYGDGIAFVEHASGDLAGGRTLYVWMRMPDVLGKDAAFFELMKFTADQLDGQASAP